jgi:hypothetical protein
MVKICHITSGSMTESGSADNLLRVGREDDSIKLIEQSRDRCNIGTSKSGDKLFQGKPRGMLFESIFLLTPGFLRLRSAKISGGSFSTPRQASEK